MRAELSPELSAIEAAHLQGYSVEDKGVANIKGALVLSAVLCQAMKEGEEGCDGVQHFKKTGGRPVRRRVRGDYHSSCRGPKHRTRGRKEMRWPQSIS